MSKRKSNDSIRKDEKKRTGKPKSVTAGAADIGRAENK